MQNFVEPQAFRRAIEQAFNAVLVTTAELETPGPEIVYVNPALCAQTGYSADELLGQTPRVFQGPATERAVLDRLRKQVGRDMHVTVHGHHADGCPYPLADCPIHRVMATGEPLKAWRDTFYRCDGSPLDVELFASPMRGLPGAVEGLVIAFRDLSAQLALERKLESAAQRDGLTGAFNRDFFDTLLEHEYARATRQRQPVSLLLLDIDHFKSINDTYGHLMGDEVLKAVVIHVQEQLRGTDVLTRWGGEEFALLLPGTTLEGAQTLAETLRASIASKPLGADLPPITVSLGVAQFDIDGNDQDAFQRADEALYAAKEDGRNRVRTAPAS
ncbi:MAG: sensor domain-containing diguanylate cyclase [Lamprobacter sp.]|uniref:sensor domain-containing diguanylate cyclase n=1 Tax=Lamprobacter sp. TaxID=3100796 RepID=UPI002B2593F6|nr:sensor domain-containing diguanylate cyclase [Lamprobacter sp.]MEA3643381.1 sensor domain-containing diguanylate cyclase [Lamprobacter sp.]